MFILEVMSGPLDGKTWTFEHEITIGRDDAVARRLHYHRSVYFPKTRETLRGSGDRLVLTDLSSRNGTHVDGRADRRARPRSAGRAFTVGRTLLRVIRTG